MDEMKLSPDRVEVLKKITEYEREGRFDEDVENDPPAPELLPDQVDYLCKKLSSKVSRKIANFVADHFFLRLIKKKELVIDGVTGEEYLTALKNGAIVTCNHFHPYDNYAVFHCIRKALPKKYLYKVNKSSLLYFQSYKFLFLAFRLFCSNRNKKILPKYHKLLLYLMDE